MMESIHTHEQKKVNKAERTLKHIWIPILSLVLKGKLCAHFEFVSVKSKQNPN